MKKLITFMGAALLLAGLGIGCAQADVHPSPPVEINTPSGTIADITDEMTDPAMLVDGHIYFPLRSYANLFPNSDVDWNADERVASILWNNTYFVSPVDGSPYLKTDGTLDDKAIHGVLAEEDNQDNYRFSPGKLIDNRTYVPMRAIVEAMGGQVDYDAETHRATLTLMHNIISKTPDITPPTGPAVDSRGVQTFATAVAPYFLDEKDSNQTFSPLSLYIALSMVTQGAGGATANELLTALHAKDIDSLTKEAKEFMALNHDDQTGTLAIANSIWINNGVTINNAFKEKLTKDYASEAMNVNMKDAADLKKITAWIEDKTNKLIHVDFDPSNDLLKLVNTVYFKSYWEDSFSKELTEEKDFTLANGNKIKVPTMQKSVSGLYTSNDLFECARLPFKDGTQLYILLPKEGKTTTDVIASLDKFDGYWQKANSYDYVNWKLPKFDFGSDFNVKPILEKNNIRTAFSNSADFSGISTQKLKISSVMQYNKIKIDEEGGEAAAATIISMEEATAIPDPPKPTSVDFDVNRPFVFLLKTDSGLPLFIGQVQNPTK